MTTENLWRWFILAVVVSVKLLTCQGNRDNPVDIVVTDWGATNIVKLNVEGYNVRQTTLFSSIFPQGIVYDDVEKRLYWIEWSPNRIRSSDVDGRNVSLVTNLPSGSPWSLAVGLVSRKLFYNDLDRDVITSMDITGENLNTILNKTQVDDPRSITVHERKGIIIWSDQKTGYKISSSNFDGSDIKRIVDVTPTVDGMAVDERGDVLYWSGSSGRIGSVFLDGTNRRVLYHQDKHLLDLVLLGNTLYFTVYQDRVHRMLINGSNVEEIQSKFSYPCGLVVLASKTLDVTTRDVTAPDVITPDTVDVKVPDVTAPHVITPNTVDVMVPDVTTPDVITPDTVDVMVPDVTTPDVITPDTVDVMVPDVTAPDVITPDTVDVMVPDVTAPDVITPDTVDVMNPDVTAPDVITPDTVDVKVPDVTAPHVITPNTVDVMVPDVTTPDVITPDTVDVMVPDVTAPDVITPDTVDVMNPDVTAPDVITPDTVDVMVPDVTAPDVPARSSMIIALAIGLPGWIILLGVLVGIFIFWRLKHRRSASNVPQIYDGLRYDVDCQDVIPVRGTEPQAPDIPDVSDPYYLTPRPPPEDEGEGFYEVF